MHALEIDASKQFQFDFERAQRQFSLSPSLVGCLSLACFKPALAFNPFVGQTKPLRLPASVAAIAVSGLMGRKRLSCAIAAVVDRSDERRATCFRPKLKSVGRSAVWRALVQFACLLRNSAPARPQTHTRPPRVSDFQLRPARPIRRRQGPTDQSGGQISLAASLLLLRRLIAQSALLCSSDVTLMIQSPSPQSHLRAAADFRRRSRAADRKWPQRSRARPQET